MDRFRILVTMATESIHKVLMGENGVANFSRFLFILAGNEYMQKISDELENKLDPTIGCLCSDPFNTCR